MNKINLNDILNIKNLKDVKVRFNLMLDNNWNPIEIFKNNEINTLLKGQYWNYKKQKSFKEGQTTIGFIKIKRKEDFWLLFHIGKVIKDLNVFDGIGYEYETLSQYEKYFGRLIIKFKNTSQNMIRKGEAIIGDCEVSQLLPNLFDNDIFPGYNKVDISWKELSKVLEKDTWKTALQNQKGVYLISDTYNGKMYVGAAYGEEMILNRWRCYIDTCHGGNVELRQLDTNYIKDNFRFSILDIFKSTTESEIIIERENYWKEVLHTRQFGYNSN